MRERCRAIGAPTLVYRYWESWKAKSNSVRTQSILRVDAQNWVTDSTVTLTSWSAACRALPSPNPPLCHALGDPSPAAILSMATFRVSSHRRREHNAVEHRAYNPCYIDLRSTGLPFACTVIPLPHSVVACRGCESAAAGMDGLTATVT